MLVRRCTFVMPDGGRCRAAPRRDGTFCFLHDPASKDEAANAQRLGGARRRRDATLAHAYDVAGVSTVEDLQRIVEIVAFDALGLENSIARLRVLLAVATTGAKLIETRDLAARVEALEAALAGGPGPTAAEVGRGA